MVLTIEYEFLYEKDESIRDCDDPSFSYKNYIALHSRIAVEYGHINVLKVLCNKFYGGNWDYFNQNKRVYWNKTYRCNMYWGSGLYYTAIEHMQFYVLQWLYKMRKNKHKLNDVFGDIEDFVSHIRLAIYNRDAEILNWIVSTKYIEQLDNEKCPDSLCNYMNEEWDTIQYFQDKSNPKYICKDHGFMEYFEKEYPKSFRILSKFAGC